MKCHKHPKYMAKRRPRCACEPCWWLWFCTIYSGEMHSDPPAGIITKKSRVR